MNRPTGTPKATPLHPQLDADTHRLGAFPEGVLLLHKDAALPWFILVPQGDHQQLHELPVSQRDALSRRCDALAVFITDHWHCDRINQAAIGNLVPQLHLHIIGRREDDPCWPGVVWGRMDSGLHYDADEVERLRRTLAGEFELVLD